MSSKFTNAMDGRHGPTKRTPRVTLTENGALTNASTFDAVLDFYSKSGALRGRVGEFMVLFVNAYRENKLLAVRALFQARDCRGGNGERSNFRTALDWIARNDPRVFTAIAKWVPHFGRWDDLFFRVTDEVANIVRTTWKADMYCLDTGRPSTLLAKWMPSENASSRETRERAHEMMSILGLTPRQYRQSLSALRRHINVVERQMSANQWEDIDYERVPSQASKLYRKAFGKHDQERYAEYLASVSRGEKKINASTLSPVQLVSQAIHGNDATIDALWNNLPNYMQDKSMIVVADTSGSMSGAPMWTAVALALYAAERNNGPFHNRWMNFSDNPSWQTIKGRTLYEKIGNIDYNNWNGSTDLVKVFRMILDTGVKYNLAQEDMPQIVTVISDMQFNPTSGARNFFTTYENIRAMYRNAGYEAPVIVWWNVRASHGQPVTKSDTGCVMVSGESASAFKGLMEADVNKLLGITPYDYMLDQLNGERYGVINF